MRAELPPAGATACAMTERTTVTREQASPLVRRSPDRIRAGAYCSRRRRLGLIGTSHYSPVMSESGTVVAFCYKAQRDTPPIHGNRCYAVCSRARTKAAPPSLFRSADTLRDIKASGDRGGASGLVLRKVFS